MANQIRIKRRSSTGSAGAPSSLLNAELAYNEADNILYYGFGDNGSGVATSVVAIAGAGSSLTLGGTQTVTGDKTFSGLVDLTGTFKIDGVEVTASAAEINHLVGVTSGVQGQLDAITTDVSDLQTGTGLADGSANYGTATTAGFSGNTVSDDATIKQALIDLETAHEAANSDTVDLRTLSGTSSGDTDLGTFTGAVISDNTTTKAALGELEAELEKVEGILGTSAGDTNMGAYGGTGSILSDSGTVKAALEELEAAIEDGSGTVTADTGTAEYSSGNLNISGGTGLSTTGDNVSTLTIALDDTAVTAASYGAADTVSTFTVDAQGRLTAAADATISIVHTQVSDFDAGVQANRLDQLTQPTASVELNNQLITGLADPVSDQDAVNKRYADALVTGLDIKDSVRVATTASITLSGTQTIDGVSVVADDRVLVKNQTDASENGIYVCAAGAWTRAEDADNSPTGEVTSGMFTFVEEGSSNADAGYVLHTANPITLDSTDLSFVQFSGAGQIDAGAGLTKTANQINVGTANADRIVVNANDIDLATHGTSGTYNGLTVDAYGRVSSFTTPTTLAGYSISDAQPLDTGLTSISGLTTAADQIIYLTDSDTYATTGLTTFVRSLLDDADAATFRTTLGLGTMATQAANNVDIDGGTIDGINIDGGTF